MVANQPVAFLDDPNAPELFADGTAGYFNANGVIRIAFESLRANHVTNPSPINRVVTARLVMPFDAAEAFARSLLDFVAQQRAQQAPTSAGVSTHH